MSDIINEHDVTLAVLAGGEGARMGRPKGELRVRGRPILAHLVEQLSWRGPTLLVTAPGRERPPGAERFEREVTDAVAGEGPLRGLYTALHAAMTEIVLVATVDMPEVTAAQLNHIALALRERADCVALLVGRDPRAADSVEPFPLAYRRSAIEMIRAELASGRRSMKGLIRLPRVEVLPAPSDWSPRVWTNLNEPGDLEAYLRESESV